MNKCQVLLSCYNGEKYIESQIDSILKQNNVEVNLLVRDDGSNDKTIEILKKYPEIELITGKNIGIVNSFYYLLLKSSNDFEYFAFSDQDDLWLPEKLNVAITKINEKKINKPILYCSNLFITDNNLEIKQLFHDKRYTFSSDLLELSNYVTGCTIVINKYLKDLVVNTNIDLNNIIMHDWLLGFIAKNFGEIIYDSNAHILYRQHTNNVVGYYKKALSFKNIINKLRLSNDGLLSQLNEFNHILLCTNNTNVNYIGLISNNNSFISRLFFLIKKANLKRKNFISTITFKILYLIGYYKTKGQ